MPTNTLVVPTLVIPNALVKATGSQSIPFTTETDLAFGADVRNQWGMHSTVTNNQRITFLMTGWFLLWFSLTWANITTTPTRQIARITTTSGGVDTVQVSLDAVEPGGASDFKAVGVSIPYYATVNDYARVRVWHNYSPGGVNSALSIYYDATAGLWAQFGAIRLPGN